SALFTTGLIRQGNFGTTDESDALTAFPNPAHENVQLRYFSGLLGKARLTVYDLSGRSLLMETKTVMEGENRFELSLKDLQSGTYLIRLDQGEQTKVIRIVKE
ncbi:MAG: T9SS type A sorting domain-containing protein, partial [Bacteroidia bacterium]|nr:T9SS type A sorting domain-containing protein [Bacteroidia bacterium]